MKTIPLDELLPQITPLPYRWHSEKVGEDGDHCTRILHAETSNTIARMGDPALDDSCPEAVDIMDAAYLAHAANVLPEVVEALGKVKLLLAEVRAGIPGCNLDVDHEFDVVSEAITKATQVPIA